MPSGNILWFCQLVDIGMHRSSFLLARILTLLDVDNQTLHHLSEAYRSNIQPFRQSKFKREGGGTFQVNNRRGRNAAGMKVSGRGGAAGVERKEGRNRKTTQNNSGRLQFSPLLVVYSKFKRHREGDSTGQLRQAGSGLLLRFWEQKSIE